MKNEVVRLGQPKRVFPFASIVIAAGLVPSRCSLFKCKEVLEVLNKQGIVPILIQLLTFSLLTP